jgi:hypothetical protein
VLVYHLTDRRSDLAKATHADYYDSEDGFPFKGRRMEVEPLQGATIDGQQALPALLLLLRFAPLYPISALRAEEMGHPKACSAVGAGKSQPLFQMLDAYDSPG